MTGWSCSPRARSSSRSAQETYCGGAATNRSGDRAPSFYEKRRAVKPVLARLSRALNSFPLKAVFPFLPSQNR